MTDLNFQTVLDNIKKNIPFSYSRYGDGEWNAILGKTGQNCDKHKYFPEMGKRLKRIIDNKPSYYIGLQSLAKNQNQGKNPEFDRLVAKNQWCSTEVFTRASIKGVFNQFYEALRHKHVLFVANKHTCDALAKLHPQIFWHFIYVSEIDCWKAYSTILPKIKATSAPFLEHKNLIILYSASMMTNVLIDDIFAAHGNTLTQLDMGSVFDPYVGRQTRSYHKTLNL